MLPLLLDPFVEPEAPRRLGPPPPPPGGPGGGGGGKGGKAAWGGIDRDGVCKAPADYTKPQQTIQSPKKTIQRCRKVYKDLTS